MKNSTLILTSLLLFLFSGNTVQAQIIDCTPDTTVVDTADPGQLEPDTFPPAHLNEYYSQTATIIPPPSFDGFPIIYSIIIDSVVNLPQGLNWGKNVAEFLVTEPDTHYCVEIYGIPEETGDFQLSLYISPWVDVGHGPAAAGQQIDDTSIMIRVDNGGSIETLTNNFNIHKVYPNPFTTETTINFETLTKGTATLKVYNILGKLLYKEEKSAFPGKNHFNFTGQNLSAGTYIFTIEMHGNKETSRLMKTR